MDFSIFLNFSCICLLNTLKGRVMKKILYLMSVISVLFFNINNAWSKEKVEEDVGGVKSNGLLYSIVNDIDELVTVEFEFEKEDGSAHVKEVINVNAGEYKLDELKTDSQSGVYKIYFKDDLLFWGYLGSNLINKDPFLRVAQEGVLFKLTNIYSQYIDSSAFLLTVKYLGKDEL